MWSGAWPWEITPQKGGTLSWLYDTCSAPPRRFTIPPDRSRSGSGHRRAQTGAVVNDPLSPRPFPGDHLPASGVVADPSEGTDRACCAGGSAGAFGRLRRIRRRDRRFGERVRGLRLPVSGAVRRSAGVADGLARGARHRARVPRHAGDGEARRADEPLRDGPQGSGGSALEPLPDRPHHDLHAPRGGQHAHQDSGRRGQHAIGY